MRRSSALLVLTCLAAALVAALGLDASLAGAAQVVSPRLATRGWTPQTNGLSHNATLNGVAVTSTSTVWAVGMLPDTAGVNRGVIYRSTDGGAQWTRRTLAADNTGLTSVAFFSTRGWAVGYSTTSGGKQQHGFVLSTANGGVSWKVQNSHAGVRLNAVSVVDTNNAWVVGDKGAVRCTANGGTTWTARNTGKATSLRGVTFLDWSHGWAVGDNGTIMHTSNGGKSWAKQTSHTHASLCAVAFTSATSGWVAGSGGTILHTTNGGGTWKSQSSNLGTYVALSSLVFTDSTHAWAVGSASYGLWGVVLYTNDAGKTWKTQRYRVGAGLSAVACPAHSLLAWIAGDKGVVLHTSDGGGTGFIDKKPPTTKALNSITVAKGKSFTVKYAVDDTQSPRAATWIEVKTSTGKDAGTFWVGLEATNATLTAKLTATMAKGSYVYTVVAIDLAGRTVAAPGANTLIVK